MCHHVSVFWSYIGSKSMGHTGLRTLHGSGCGGFTVGTLLQPRESGKLFVAVKPQSHGGLGRCRLISKRVIGRQMYKNKMDTSRLHSIRFQLGDASATSNVSATSDGPATHGMLLSE